MPLTDLFPRCERYKTNVRYARDYLCTGITRCDSCSGHGVYRNLEGKIEVCDDFKEQARLRGWREI